MQQHLNTSNNFQQHTKTFNNLHKHLNTFQDQQHIRKLAKPMNASKIHQATSKHQSIKFAGTSAHGVLDPKPRKFVMRSSNFVILKAFDLVSAQGRFPSHHCFLGGRPIGVMACLTTHGQAKAGRQARFPRDKNV